MQGTSKFHFIWHLKIFSETTMPNEMKLSSKTESHPFFVVVGQSICLVSM